MPDIDRHRPFPSSPVVAGLALLGKAVLLKNWCAGALDLPQRELDLPQREDDCPHEDQGARRAVRVTRYGIATLMPRNLTRSVARSLTIVAASLILVRALDELVDEEETLF